MQIFLFVGIAIFSALILVGVFFIGRFSKKAVSEITRYESSVIVDRIVKECKLIHFSVHVTELLSYDQAKKVFFDLIELDKNALVIVKAKVSIGHDLKKLVCSADDKSKTITIKKIPALEVLSTDIYDFKIHSLNDSVGNRFVKEDFNKLYPATRRYVNDVAMKREVPSLEQFSQEQLKAILKNLHTDTAWTIKLPPHPLLEMAPKTERPVLETESEMA